MKLRPFSRQKFIVICYSQFPVYNHSYGLNFFTTTIALRKVINIVANVKNFKITFINFRKYCFQIIIKNLTKCNILKTLALKNNGKFAEHNEKNCVLGPWPWSRAFLLLASRGFVLEKSVLGLVLGFFSSFWPRRLCSRLHLWYWVSFTIAVWVCSSL